MNRSNIYRLIKESEKVCHTRKLKRYFYTVLFYTAVNLQLFYWNGMLDRNVLHILGAVLFAAVIAVITFVANFTIFDQLFRMDKEDNEKHEMIKRKLDEMK